VDSRSLGRVAFLASVLAVRPLAAADAPTRPTDASGDASGPSIQWEKDFKGALKKARVEGRPLLVDFWADWCHWCHQLDATTYRDPAVVAATAAFVPVKVNTEGSLTEKQISADYGVETLPTIAFLSPQGHVVLVREKFEEPAAFARTVEVARTTAVDVMAWEDALSRDKNDPAALASLGAHLFALERLDQSRELLERAAKHDAARPVSERKHIRVLLGAIEARAKRYGDAEKLLQSALALQPANAAEDGVALFDLGEAYLKEGRAEAASAAWTKAAATAPDGPMAQKARKELAKLPR
jgi:thioredoxin-like negative regulator of GroEL